MKRIYGLAGAPTLALRTIILAGSVALAGCGTNETNPMAEGPPPAPPEGYKAPNETMVTGRGGKQVKLIDDSDDKDKGPAALRKRGKK